MRPGRQRLRVEPAALGRGGRETLLEAAPTLGLDRLTRLATAVAGTPIGLAALVDREEVRYKAAVNLAT